MSNSLKNEKVISQHTRDNPDCGKLAPPRLYTFPTRRPPHDKTFYALEYYSDPFFEGTGREYCSAKCFVVSERKT